MRKFSMLGAVNGFFAVALGAFGAHALKDKLTPELMNDFQIGAHYHLTHALALLAVGLLAGRVPSKPAGAAGWLFTVGILVFCGSLYLLAITGKKWLGAITPIGGACFLSGWICLFLAARAVPNN